MKVILLQDVAKIGKRSEIVEVPDGYALNQLIPKRMAEPATIANKKRIERLQQDTEAKREQDKARFDAAIKALGETKIQIKTEVNEQGHLFKAVSENDIAEASQAAGIDIDAAMVVVGKPIKEAGEHEVHLVRGDHKATFVIEVIKQ